MRRLPYLLIVFAVLYVAGHLAALWLGQTPAHFFTVTLPGWVGGSIVLVGIGVVAVQLSRR